jgi:hypothetical protein
MGRLALKLRDPSARRSLAGRLETAAVVAIGLALAACGPLSDEEKVEAVEQKVIDRLPNPEGIRFSNVIEVGNWVCGEFRLPSGSHQQFEGPIEGPIYTTTNPPETVWVIFGDFHAQTDSDDGPRSQCDAIIRNGGTPSEVTDRLLSGAPKQEVRVFRQP